MVNYLKKIIRSSTNVIVSVKYKKISNALGVIIFVILISFWGIHKLKNKNFLTYENSIVIDTKNKNNLKKDIYNKWQRCEYSFFSKLEKCIKIKVPVNWQDKKSSQIEFFARRYGNSHPHKIILILSGGPVGSENSYIHLAKELYKQDNNILVLIPDHRGTGHSEKLHCPISKQALSIHDTDNQIFSSCFEYLKTIWQEQLKYFNSKQGGQDVQELLKLYPKLPIYIYASSYGTIWAQQVLHKNHLNVKKVYLESPFIIGHSNYLERNINKPIMVFFENCIHSHYCKEIMNVNHITELKKIFTDVFDGKMCLNKLSLDTVEMIKKKSLWLLQYNFTAPLFPLLVNAIQRCDELLIKNIFKYKNEINMTEIGNYRYSVYLHYNIYCNEMVGRENYNKKFKNDFGFEDNSLLKCQYVPEAENTIEKIQYQNVNFNTLIVTGEADISATSEFSQALNLKFPPTQVKLIKVKNLAHLPLSFRIHYEDFFSLKYHDAEKCRIHILAAFFKEEVGWPDLRCVNEIYPAIYSSDSALKHYESVFNNT